MKNLILVILFFITYFTYSQETYKIGTTEYYYNQYYSTTGNPVIKRSETNKKNFLKSKGYTQTPYGYEIDHIIPLSQGGSDDPSNMQLLTVEQHKTKTANERRNKGLNSSSTNNNINYDDITYATYSRTDQMGYIIYRDTNGKEYYATSNGGKSYLKSNNSNFSSPTSTQSNNTNINFPSSPSSTSSNREIHTGPRGGKYYINSNGNKTYIKN